MRFEHRREKVAPLSKFIARLGRYGIFSLMLICASLLIGSFGYRYYQQLTWIDSFYMASMILTGMGPVADMTTENAKIFSSIYALYSGVAFLSITGIFFAPIIHRLLHILHVESEAK